MTYTVNIKPLAQRYLKKLSISLQIRMGDYRIIYEIHDNILVVIVVEIGHRSDIYWVKAPLPLNGVQSEALFLTMIKAALLQNL